MSRKRRVEVEEKDYEEKVALCSAIAKPMAPRKLFKKIEKLISNVAAHKKYFAFGLKMVQKQLRLGHKGIVIFAGDVWPIDIICHLPAVCEEKNIPYCFVPSRRDISAAMGYTRECVIVYIKEYDDHKNLYNKVKNKIIELGNQL